MTNIKTRRKVTTEGILRYVSDLGGLVFVEKIENDEDLRKMFGI